MIFNSLSLIITNFYNLKNSLGVKINTKKIFILLTLVLSLFLISLLIVEKYRSNYNFNSLNIVKSNKESLKQENYLKKLVIKKYLILSQRDLLE